MKIPPLPFFTDTDLMARWGITADALRVYVSRGMLTLTLENIDGQPRQGATAEEVARFEGSSGGEPKQHGSQRKGDRMLLALMAAAYYASDESLIGDEKTYHYRLLKLIASDVKTTQDRELPRSEESDALALKEGFDLLRADGWRPKNTRQRPAATGPVTSSTNAPISEVRTIRQASGA